MRHVILYAVIAIGFGLVAAAAYYLIPGLHPSAQTVTIAGRGECAVEVDAASVAWPRGYDQKVKAAIDAEIDKAVTGLLASHLPPETAMPDGAAAAQAELIKWCQDNYSGLERYSVDIDVKVTRNTGGILSLQIIDNYRTGSSSAAVRSMGLVMDTATGRRLALADFLLPGKLSAFAQIEHKRLLTVAESLIYAGAKEEIESFLAAPTEAKAKDWYASHGYLTVTADAIVISYNMGDISSRNGGGILNMSIPKSELAGIVKN